MPLVDAVTTDTHRVAVIIVNYNGGDVILQCLTALQHQKFRDFQTVVVDNHSTDTSLSAIQRDFPWVRLLALETNRGFAGGVNHALRECPHGSLVALLNPDAFPAPDWLANLVAAADQHPQYAAFGSRMFSDEAMQALDGVGDVYHISGLPWRQGHGQPNSTRYDRSTDIFAPCAAAALYRADALNAVGCFDEDLFLYAEDVDVGFRLQLAGYRSLYVADARVWHVGSVFVGKHSDFQIYHGHRNLVWVFVKNMPGLLFWLALPLHVALNIVSILWFTLKGQGRVILRAKWDALRGLTHFWGKRKTIQSLRKASTTSIAKALRWSMLRRRYR